MIMIITTTIQLIIITIIIITASIIKIRLASPRVRPEERGGRKGERESGREGGRERAMEGADGGRGEGRDSRAAKQVQKSRGKKRPRGTCSSGDPDLSDPPTSATRLAAKLREGRKHDNCAETTGVSEKNIPFAPALAMQSNSRNCDLASDLVL